MYAAVQDVAVGRWAPHAGIPRLEEAAAQQSEAQGLQQDVGTPVRIRNGT